MRKLCSSWNKATSKPFVPGCSPSFSGRRRTSVCVLGATCVRGPLLFSPVLVIGISVPCRKPSTKESELKKTEGLEREAEADHCRAPVHHLSSGGRGGLVARIFASRCPLEREAYNQVHEGPQLPAGSPPRNSSRWCRWCRDPFFQSLSTVCGTVRHWMICPSLVVSTTEDLTRDFREVVEYN